jgi:2-polyprenyl-3-methyl-5-hydroxy-6-metoxy-1,4-benzoquinol methylase
VRRAIAEPGVGPFPPEPCAVVTQSGNAGLEKVLESATFVCKLCESTDIDRSYQLEARPGPQAFKAVRCARCGLFQELYDWQEASQQQESLKDDFVYRFEPLWDGDQELAAMASKASAFATILDEAGLIRGKRILEVGCGYGYFLDACRSRGAASVTGQEFFRGHVLAHARDELSLDDIRSVPFGDRSVWPDAEFDVVCSFDVAEHVHDLRTFLAEGLRLTKPGGSIFHATPGSDGLANQLGRTVVSLAGQRNGVRVFGTRLCNLAPVRNLRGDAHVSLMGRRSVQWLAAEHLLKVDMLRYVASYTYSDEHYAQIVPGLQKLPLTVGSRMFAVGRRMLPNKLVFLATKRESGRAAA